MKYSGQVATAKDAGIWPDSVRKSPEAKFMVQMRFTEHKNWPEPYLYVRSGQILQANIKKELHRLLSKEKIDATGFEPAASASRTQRSTKLSHASNFALLKHAGKIIHETSF